MGKLIFMLFVWMSLFLHTAQTEELIYVRKGEDIHLPIGNLTEGNSILVNRTDMREPYYVFFERDGQSDGYFQHPAYQNRTSRENNSIIIRNATTTDSGPFTIAVIPDKESEENRLKTPPTRTYRVLVTEEKVQNKENENLWLMVGLLLCGFIVVLAAVALVYFFYKPLKELCLVYFCKCFIEKESESSIPV